MKDQPILTQDIFTDTWRGEYIKLEVFINGEGQAISQFVAIHTPVGEVGRYNSIPEALFALNQPL